MTSQLQPKKDMEMGNERFEPIKKDTRMFQFDPTIHAGHILTIVTIIFCSIGAWYDVKSSVAILKEENVRQDKKAEELQHEQGEQAERLSQDITALAAMNRQDLTKIRDDMNQWFMRLNDKLDMKADRK